MPDNVSFEIREGEFVVLCGKSGCGKTTLLRLLKPCLAPEGDMRGEILFDGMPVYDVPERERAQKIGFVMQDVESQIVTDKVWHELAFGLESLGCETEEIRRRVAEMAGFFGIGSWFRKNVTELSGGQKQLMNLAAVMVMNPSVLILDEPTAQLDPIAADNFLSMLKKINSEIGTTIILSEHRLEETIPLCSRLLVMDNGRLVCGGKPRTVVKELLERGHEISEALPCASRLYHKLDGSGEYPLTVREGRDWLTEYAKGHKIAEIKEQAADRGGEIAAELRGVWFRYSEELDDVSRGLNLKAYRGELLTVIGGNGEGKTTALSLLSGLNKPYCGKVLINGAEIDKVKNLYDGVLGAVPQNPQLIFVKKTLGEDLREAVRDKRNKEEKVREAAVLCGLEKLLDRHPYDLSGGEQQRAALAKILVREPEILLLDEPTKGMDAGAKHKLALILKSLTARGKTVIAVSHDIEFCAEYADRCAMFFDGEISAASEPKKFFASNTLYTTAARRISRGIIENAVTEEDIVRAFADNAAEETKPGKPEYIEPGETWKTEDKTGIKETAAEKSGDKPVYPRKENKRKIKHSAPVMLLLIPLTVLAGWFYFGDRRYYFMSLLITAEAMIPFLLSYESRKPRARELVVIAVLCALTAAGRTAFFWLPQFKPMAAMVIISGAAFGGEAGFLVGAVSAFISNFYFGQGPWTPWQMFSFGLIGFLAGIIFRKGIRLSGALPMAVYGFFAVMLIYGGIMNPAGVLMYQQIVTKEIILAAYVSGFPFDLIHAGSTAAFLIIGARPMLEKLERVKQKYGI
ncbi:MAG: ATP-binding cassette domain-containing protein [bacterium]|nr:ATP-binding cassette domain-containing protein [bacterium]